jgi:hypothetical protein
MYFSNGSRVFSPESIASACFASLDKSKIAKTLVDEPRFCHRIPGMKPDAI